MLHVCVTFLPELAPLFGSGVFYVIKISSKQAVAGWETNKELQQVKQSTEGFGTNHIFIPIAVLSFPFDILAEPEHFFTENKKSLPVAISDRAPFFPRLHN